MVYTSPILKARPGSTHGYDIVAHDALNPELGNSAELDGMVAAFSGAGLKVLLDFVPNHMGVSGAGHIQQQLLTALPSVTPVAIVQRASLPDQRHAVATLGQLAATIEAEGLASPAVIVVGDVLRGLAAVQAEPARLRNR